MRLLTALLFTFALGISVQSEEAPYWLDKAQAEDAYKKLSETPDKDRDPGTWVKLGWIELLHQNDADRAMESFARAAEKDPAYGDAHEGLQAAATARLRTDVGAKAIAAMMEAEPDSARTEAMLRVGRVQAGAFVTWTVPERIAFAEKLLAKTKNPRTALALHAWMQGQFETQLRTDEGFQHWLAQGHVAKWHAIGYFGENGAASYDDELPPEREFKPGAEYAVGRQSARWEEFEATPGDTDLQGALRHITNRGTAFFVRSVLDSAEERAAFVRIRSTMSWKVWLNGVPVGANDLVRNFAAWEQWHGVTLSKGPNVLLVKFVAPGMEYSFDLTMHHADGRAMTDLRSGFEGKSPEPEPNGKEARGGAPAGDALEALALRTKDFAGCTLREAMLCGQLYESLGLHQQAERLDRQIFEKLPTSAYVQFFHGAFVENYPLLPDARRENVARTHFERAVALDARFAPALMSLARANERKDSDKALEYLQQVLAANSGCADAHQMLARIYGGRGWRAEQQKALEKAAECARGDFGYAAELAQWHAQNQNFQKAFGIIAAIKKTHEVEAWWEEINLLGQAGRDADQLAALEAYRRRFPKNARCPMEMAAVKERMGRTDEAEQLLKMAGMLDPRNGEIPRRLLEIYVNHRDLDKARAQLAVVLAEPARIMAYDENLRRYVLFLAGDGDDWTKPWNVDAREIVRNAPATEDFPTTAHSVILFEQRLVRVIGTDFKWREEDIHRVVKILSKEGGENYGQLGLGRGEWARFRLRELRVFTPDGRVLEMDSVQEEGRWRMPELDKGAILEFRVSRGNGPIGVDQPVFEVERSPLFQRQNEPVVRSRYVVVIPKGAPIRVRTLNLSAPAVTVETEETTTHTWEFRDLPEFEPEQAMPPAPEVLPGVRFVFGKPSMEAMLERARSRGMGSPVADDVMAKALELTVGLESPEARVRALYKFAVTEIKSGDNSTPSHTLADLEGDPTELLAAFFKAAGISFQYAWCRGPSPNYPEYDVEMALPMYGTELLLVNLPTGDVWLWPWRWNAFGALPNQIYGGEALVVDGRTAYFRALPARTPEEKAVATRIEVKVDENAMADIKGALVLQLGTAAAARGQLEQFIGKDQLKAIVAQIANGVFKGIVVNSHGISEFDLDRPSCEVTFEGTSKGFAQRKKGSDLITFRGIVPPLDLSRQLLRESVRKYPLRASWADDITNWNVLTIELPEYESVRLPDSTALSTQFGTYNVTYKLTGRTLRVERRLVMNPIDIAPDRYAALAEMLKTIDDAEKRQVTVKVKAKDEGVAPEK